MITDLFLSVFEVSIATGGIAAVCMILLPLLNRRYAAKWSYYIWIFLAVRLLLPVSGQAVLESAQRTMRAFSQGQEVQRGTAPAAVPRQRVVIEIPPGMTTPVTAPQEERAAFTVLDAAALVWFFGCAVSFSFPVGSYLAYRKRMRKRARLLEDGAVYGSLRALSEELHIRRLPAVFVYDGNGSPMVMGIFRPVLVLPKQCCTEEELYFILKHELVHLKRHDVPVKLLLVAANAVHWFNPLVYLLKRCAVVDMELSCDEQVIRGVTYAGREAYAETLFSTIQTDCGKRTYLSTKFYGGKKIMEKRFKNIFTGAGKKNGMLVFSGAVMLTLVAGTLVSCGVNDAGASGNFNTVGMRTGGEDAQAEKEDGMPDEPADDGIPERYDEDADWKRTVENPQVETTMPTLEKEGKEGADSGEIYETVLEFADAYFGGDADALRAYLADSFEGKAETYQGAGTAEQLKVRGLDTDGKLPVGSMKEVSLEFKDSTEDSFTYLTYTLVKQEDGWKVQWYGLEK